MENRVKHGKTNMSQRGGKARNEGDATGRMSSRLTCQHQKTMHDETEEKAVPLK